MEYVTEAVLAKQEERQMVPADTEPSVGEAEMARLQEKPSHFGSNGQPMTCRTESSSPLCDRSNNDYHQQYLDKNPGGYCGIGPNGMTCPVGVAKSI